MSAPKRFYETVAIRPAEPGEGTGLALLLDGRPVRTPDKRLLLVPTGPLAEAMAEEWRGQADQIAPATMPLTQLANTVLDRVAPNRSAVVEMVVGYAGTDLVCYRADRPESLVARQHAAWQPLVEWAARQLDAALVVTSGLMPVDQPEAAVGAIRAAVEAVEPHRLTALAHATGQLGSVVLGLALLHRRIDAAEAVAAAQVDELHQEEHWGHDAEAAARRAAVAAEVGAAARFLRMLDEA